MNDNIPPNTPPKISPKTIHAMAAGIHRLLDRAAFLAERKENRSIRNAFRRIRLMWNPDENERREENNKMETRMKLKFGDDQSIQEKKNYRRTHPAQPKNKPVVPSPQLPFGDDPHQFRAGREECGCALCVAWRRKA